MFISLLRYSRDKLGKPRKSASAYSAAAQMDICIAVCSDKGGACAHAYHQRLVMPAEVLSASSEALKLAEACDGCAKEIVCHVRCANACKRRSNNILFGKSQLTYKLSCFIFKPFGRLSRGV